MNCVERFFVHVRHVRDEHLVTARDGRDCNEAARQAGGFIVRW